MVATRNQKAAAKGAVAAAKKQRTGKRTGKAEAGCVSKLPPEMNADPVCNHAATTPSEVVPCEPESKAFSEVSAKDCHLSGKGTRSSCSLDGFNFDMSASENTKPHTETNSSDPTMPLDHPNHHVKTSGEVPGITAAMVCEEVELSHQRSIKDELEREQVQKEWDMIATKTKEERFKKLQALLKKSSLYTSYLVKRMREQGYGKLLCDTTSNEENPTHSGLASCSEHDGVSTPVLFSGGSLRKYQRDGLLWLNALYENGVNGILADEMGLGKTIQCIAAISHLVSMSVGGPYLVVAPLSTVPNWVSEFEKFAPKVPVILYHGSKDERPSLRHKIRKMHQVTGELKTHPVVITSYEIAMRDRKDLMSFHWKYLIVDEGHRLKNVHCRLIRELRMYSTTHRLLLTGTPLQNNLSELWSLLNFLLPEIFDDLESFESWFQLECLTNDSKDLLVAEEKKRSILAMFHQILTPFLLRRLKTDVDLNIPPKKEVIVYAPMTKVQKALYQATVDRTIVDMLEPHVCHKDPVCSEEDSNGRSIRKSKKQKVDYSAMMESRHESDVTLDSWLTSMSSAPGHEEASAYAGLPATSITSVSLRNTLMQLRKVCNHPYLLSFPLEVGTELYRIDEELVTSSGKLQLLDRLLSGLHKRQHKVLLFSQMTRMLDILEHYCIMRNYSYCRLDGSTPLDERREQIGSFNTGDDLFIFLLSTRAGGLGINLTSADTVIIYDSDWNPQCDLQAQDRCHRIGQSRPVVVYRFVCAGTVDEKMVERAALRLRLEKLVIHKEQFKMGLHTTSFNEAAKPITPQELYELLKATEYEKSVHSDQCGKEVLSEQELDALLDRSDLMHKWKSDLSDKGANVTPSASKTGAGFEGIFKVLDDEAQK